MIDLDSLDGVFVMNESECDTSTTRATLSTRLHDQYISTASDSIEISSLSSSMFKSDQNENDADLISCMLITANVGTIFEEVSQLSSPLYAPASLRLW